MPRNQDQVWSIRSSGNYPCYSGHHPCIQVSDLSVCRNAHVLSAYLQASVSDDTSFVRPFHTGTPACVSASSSTISWPESTILDSSYILPRTLAVSAMLSFSDLKPVDQGKVELFQDHEQLPRRTRVLVICFFKIRECSCLCNTHEALRLFLGFGRFSARSIM